MCYRCAYACMYTHYVWTAVMSFDMGCPLSVYDHENFTTSLHSAWHSYSYLFATDCLQYCGATCSYSRDLCCSPVTCYLFLSLIGNAFGVNLICLHRLRLSVARLPCINIYQVHTFMLIHSLNYSLTYSLSHQAGRQGVHSFTC